MGKSGKFLGLNEIKSIVQMRHPLLMLDRVQFESDTVVVGLRNLTMNELFFQGHFPNHPILPGVLQLEAMKQLGQIAVYDVLDPECKCNIYMRVIENVKFRKPNLPGDRMKITVEILEIANGEAVIAGKVYNKSGLTCEAKITLAVREKSAPDTMPELFNELDRSDDSLMDISGIMQFMPHRYPFLFADYLAQRDGDRLLTVKNVTGGDEFFASCPDDYKVMPESLLCEVTAQSGCACILSKPENAGKIGYFMSIDRAEFFAPVYPGDQMVSDVILPPARGRFGKSSGEIRVGEKVIMKITLMFAIVDK